MIPRNRHAHHPSNTQNSADKSRTRKSVDAGNNQFSGSPGSYQGSPDGIMKSQILPAERSRSSRSSFDMDGSQRSHEAAIGRSQSHQAFFRNTSLPSKEPGSPLPHNLSSYFPSMRRESFSFFPVLDDYQQLKSFDGEFDLKVAKVYIYDAVKGRMPNLRIQQRDELPWWGFHLTPLMAYNLVHHRIWRRFLTLVVFFQLALTLWEYKYPRISLGMEVLVLFIYLVDGLLRTYSHDRDQDIGESWYPITWARAKYCFILVAFLDICVSAIAPSVRNTPYRLSRLLRPFFFVERGRVLRQLTMAVVYTIPKVMEVVFLIGVNIVIFALFGFYLFSEHGLGLGNNPNFVDIETSCWSLVVLMSTANFPDVMMASYSYSNWSAIFFVLYLFIALYLLFQIILAAVFSRFQDRAKELLSEIPKIQTVCLCAAFELLADASLIQSDPVNKISPVSPIKEEESSRDGATNDDYSSSKTSSPTSTHVSLVSTVPTAPDMDVNPQIRGLLMSEKIGNATPNQKQENNRSLPVERIPETTSKFPILSTVNSKNQDGGDAAKKKRLWEKFAGMSAELDLQQLEGAGISTDSRTKYLQAISALNPEWSGGVTAAVARNEAQYLKGSSSKQLQNLNVTQSLSRNTRRRQASVGQLDDEKHQDTVTALRVGSVPVSSGVGFYRPSQEEMKSTTDLGSPMRKEERSGSFYKCLSDPSNELDGELQSKDSVDVTHLEKSAVARVRGGDGSPITIVPGRWKEIPTSIYSEMNDDNGSAEASEDKYSRNPVMSGSSSGLALSLSVNHPSTLPNSPKHDLPAGIARIDNQTARLNEPAMGLPTSPLVSNQPVSDAWDGSDSFNFESPQRGILNSPTMGSSSYTGVVTPGVVSRKAFHRFIRFVRRDLEKDHIDIIFNAMDVSKTGFIELREWLRLIDFIDVSFRLRDDPESFRAPEDWRQKTRNYLKSSTYNTLCDIFIIFNCILVAIILSHPHSPAHKTLSRISLVFTAIFAVELIVRAAFIGVKEFFKSYLNIFDSLIITAAIILRITSASGLTPMLLCEMDIFRVIRVVRVISISKRARAILNTVGRLAPALRSLFLILLAVYYFFAVLGVGLFRGVIKRDNMPPDFMETYYAQNNYWENNFNDFTHAMVLLFEIMIINNWNLTVEAFVVATRTNWTRVYFVVYFFFTVIVALNVVVALILEAFITKYSTVDSEADNTEPDTGSIDTEYRAALTNALNEYAEGRDVADLPDSNQNDSQSTASSGDTKKLRRLWQIVLKQRTQRTYKLIFDSKNMSEHLRGE